MIPALGGLASIALPEVVMHFRRLHDPTGYTGSSFLTFVDSTIYSSDRDLRIVSILTVPLAGAVALIVAVSFDPRWSRVLPALAVAVFLTVAARELGVTIFGAGWCSEGWAFEGETRHFPACTGLLGEGWLEPVEPVP